ncbi:MAPEG family protein [Sandarakinorhabdus sp.]|uniref:MAPEG family protein n=1 Tax=Sandarakinorhabdus sp. TaxID=1916663 RepID=UPI00286DE09B|nr:MAPEG family protein [Sandarakinorhabdus sp.]
MQSAIFAPVIALAGWTLVMWVWMYATRLPAMKRAGIDGTRMVGADGTGLRAELNAKGEQRASWVADNYNHLHEQPTLFYAVALVLAMIGQGGGLNATIAWAYVALRVAHSLVQVTVNVVLVRFVLFSLGTLALMALTLHAGIAVFHG